MNRVLDQSGIAKRVINRTENIFGEKIGLVGLLFGCRHRQLTRPFTVERQSYRACLECGARRHFDAENLKTFGSFYYPPTVSPANNKR